MKRDLKIIIGCISLVFVALAIALVISYTLAMFSNENSWDESRDESRCPPMFSDFSELDLIGTWRAGTPDHSDTLIIKSDGTYKQLVYAEFAEKSPLEYESSWNRWQIEISEDNIPYLHLTNFAFCGMNVSISCKQPNCDGYDFCIDEHIPMEGEGILIILGPSSSEELSPEILTQDYLNLFYPLGSQGSWVYEFVEP